MKQSIFHRFWERFAFGGTLSSSHTHHHRAMNTSCILVDFNAVDCVVWTSSKFNLSSSYYRYFCPQNLLRRYGSINPIQWHPLLKKHYPSTSFGPFTWQIDLGIQIHCITTTGTDIQTPNSQIYRFSDKIFRLWHGFLIQYRCLKT